MTEGRVDMMTHTDSRTRRPNVFNGGECDEGGRRWKEREERGFEDGGQVGVDILHSCFRECGVWEVWGVMMI